MTFLARFAIIRPPRPALKKFFFLPLPITEVN